MVWSTAITHITGDLGQRCKVHSFLPNFSTSSNPSFTLQVQTIHKTNQILLILPQILAKTFVSNIIIDLSYNLSKYIQFEVFENCV